MNARLLSLLTMLQDAIARESGMTPTGTRMVNFHKSIAKLSLKDGGTIHVQGYRLADGQACVKVALWWPRCDRPAIHAIYPNKLDFNWSASVGRIALAWLAGPEAAGIVPDSESEAAPALNKLEAVG